MNHAEAVVQARTALGNLYRSFQELQAELTTLKAENAELKSKLASPRQFLVRQPALTSQEVAQFKAQLRTRISKFEQDLLAKSPDGNQSLLSNTLNASEFEELLENLVFMPESS